VQWQTLKWPRTPEQTDKEWYESHHLHANGDDNTVDSWRNISIVLKSLQNRGRGRTDDTSLGKRLVTSSDVLGGPFQPLRSRLPGWSRVSLCARGRLYYRRDCGRICLVGNLGLCASCVESCALTALIKVDKVDSKRAADNNGATWPRPKGRLPMRSRKELGDYVACLEINFRYFSRSHFVQIGIGMFQLR
jgi:hypothetical protein